MPEPTTQSEVATKADFSRIRYAQCWEDADILLAGLDIQPGDRCLSIASAGDNALAMLLCDPAEVIAIDLSPAQLACLQLRVAAYQRLDHAELLELVGSVASDRRDELYQRCRPILDEDATQFWDSQPRAIQSGIGAAGKFENYFRIFRERVLPWVHRRQTVNALLLPRDATERREFYDRCWNTWLWRMMFRVFFSRRTMAWLGRDPQFFAYVEGSVGERILSRTEHALTQLDPSQNPYLHWILTGKHGENVLPLALRKEHFDTIRRRVERVRWQCISIEDFLAQQPDNSLQRFNLSDLFEYISEENYHRLLKEIVRVGELGGRVAYWNMLVPRSRPAALAEQLKSLGELAKHLHTQDKAFFYSAFVVEEFAA